MPQTKQSPLAVARRARKAAKKAATAEQAAIVKPPMQPIDPAKSYNRDALKSVGLGHVWFREAIKRGLPVQPAGKTKFVKGSDLIEFISSGKGAAVSVKDTKADGQPTQG